MNKGLKGLVVRTSEGGLEVRSVLVLRCTCIRQRWIRVDGHISRHALSAAAKPVRDRHVGRGDAREQRHVRGLRLVRVPLHARRLAAFAVDGHDQAPAVVHVRAVRHHRVVSHPARRDGGPDVPAPRVALARGPRIAVRVARGPGGAAERPAGERVELPAAFRVPLAHDPCRRTRDAHPPLGSRPRPAVPLHRRPARGASLRLAGFRPHGIQPATGTPLFFRAEK